MLNGLWTVEFISAIKRIGRGVIIFTDNRILGGDEGYYYSGTCDISGNKLHAKINVIKHNPNSVSVFGNIDHFQLTLNGEINDYQFKAIGSIANNPHALINVVGTKREDL